MKPTILSLTLSLFVAGVSPTLTVPLVVNIQAGAQGVSGNTGSRVGMPQT
jgi:hypothetical protein